MEQYIANRQSGWPSGGNIMGELPPLVLEASFITYANEVIFVCLSVFLLARLLENV